MLFQFLMEHHTNQKCKHLLKYLNAFYLRNICHKNAYCLRPTPKDLVITRVVLEASIIYSPARKVNDTRRNGQPPKSQLAKICLLAKNINQSILVILSLG
jgi:hypothetical protein